MRWVAMVVVSGIGIVAACGGQVQSVHRDCPSNLSGASCSSGDTCSMSISGCGQTSTITCSCENGAFACPDIGIGCTPPAPPNPGNCSLQDPSPGAICTMEGLSCPEFGPPKCGDVATSCRCTNGYWQCQEPKCGQCPDPKTVQSGGNCGGQGPLSCPGTDSCGNPTSCFCMGPSWYWYCSSGCAEGGADAKTD